MSRRHIKKVFGTSELTVASSDEEYEPQCTHARKNTNAYAGLEIESSKSDSEDYESVEITSDEEEIEKKSKKKGKFKSKQSNSGTADDIDQLVSEVNAMLGELSTQADPITEDKPNPFEKIFSLRKKHLNAANEINKLLGPHDSEGNKRKLCQQKPKDVVRNPITPLSNYSFRQKGLSMHIDKMEDGITYFVYNYNLEYQKRHNLLIAYLGEGNDPRGAPVMESINSLHVEGMLVAFKLYCEAEDYMSANTILERAIFYLQYVADPLFNVTNGRTRLEYKFVENRAFHIAILLYSHMLSNKGCHRTALELAKMLLNLDRWDPLSVIFVLDVFAIRAREYAWLIEAIDTLEENRNAKLLINIKYSYALAHFHQLSKQKEDLKQADDHLKDALISFPAALKAILSHCTLPQSSRNEKILSNNLFSADESIVPLRDAMKMYASFLGMRWREPPVLEWLLRNAEEIIVMDDPVMKRQIEFKKNVRWTLFNAWPIEICRHLFLIKPMSDLLIDGQVPTPEEPRQTDYFNPLPLCRSYGYSNSRNKARRPRQLLLRRRNFTV